ncbi:NAD(P)H-hydrate dehydratase [Desulforhopalus singaporensis]|uniref:Bifunctional NAD(P)H-hydrate repair enzyme n=1 Tax=Desulforhopalus singaporensis TaxID=91360 RepID=A0A1H0PHE8_9BACT|nr:NAD(P)H-hydrate dehydratase [Desulforhopalus singaporensis]SDP04099.1 NAD(P)H-hydrate epimerase [Desulforhopalus singaporensis]
MKLPSASQMQQLDRRASEQYGIPTIVLMENAGVGTVRMALDELGPCNNTFAPIFVGPGNNGGDGLVIGRHLHQRGCEVMFFFLVNPEKLSGDPATNFKIVKQLKLPYHVVDTVERIGMIPMLIAQKESKGLCCYAVFDAIFGIGLCRELSGHFKKAVELINSAAFKTKGPVIAIDIPSGLDSDSGKTLGCCVTADYTATYGCAKPAHFLHGSGSPAGKVAVIDIGIPPAVVNSGGIDTTLATDALVKQRSTSLHRAITSHKGDNGHLFILAGSAGKSGAAILAAKGALRAGAGLVTLGCPIQLKDIFGSALPEAMTFLLSGSDTCFSIDDLAVIERELATKDVLVVGPGIGQDQRTAELILTLYERAKCPMVIDADGLNILALAAESLPQPGGPRIYTPHPGELSRLIDMDSGAINQDRLEAVKLAVTKFAGSKDSVVVLKGAGTLVADGSGQRYINTTGNPGMAAAGMGDVLSGIIGALLCQGLAPTDAALCGVYLHGSAADMLFAAQGPGFFAGDVADRIPCARRKLLVV